MLGSQVERGESEV